MCIRDSINAEYGDHSTANMSALPSGTNFMHQEGWGLHIDATNRQAISSLVTDGRLAHTVAEHGVVVLRGLGKMKPNDVVKYITSAMGGNPRPPPAPKGWPSPVDCPQIHLLGSPGSGGEFIPASADDSDKEEKLKQWIERPEAPSRTTDWHVDEPWELDPARFTILYAAESEGDLRTRFASTARFWKDGMSDSDRKICEQAAASFEPPPWLPQEEAVTTHSLMRQTKAGKAMYICADSLCGVDGMSREEAIEWCWRLTGECCTPERSVDHCWEQYDMLVLDNHSLLHARVKYDECQQNRLLYRLRMDGEPEERRRSELLEA
eukprot:TRINITY_DN8222_c0_g1_i1.p1 TRINITY_DN8222_c0_g1~~TRINITY_DN8222_c0_g1_i1.p1  ORF type:complete len:322 (-),score=71.70 TRINITY_DN8222_c0_g1_i1:183-1148(-)